MRIVERKAQICWHIYIFSQKNLIRLIESLLTKQFFSKVHIRGFAFTRICVSANRANNSAGIELHHPGSSSTRSWAELAWSRGLAILFSASFSNVHATLFQEISSRFGRIIQGKLDSQRKDTIYTDAFIARHKVRSV